MMRSLTMGTVPLSGIRPSQLLVLHTQGKLAEEEMKTPGLGTRPGVL